MNENAKRMFPEVTDEQWNNWHWQVQNRIETLEQLKKYIKLTTEEENGVKESLKTLRMAITPYYLSLIDQSNPNCPVRKQAIPTRQPTCSTLCMKTATRPHRDSHIVTPTVCCCL